MTSGESQWQPRARVVVIAGEWVAIAIGIIAAIVDAELGVEAYIASGLGAIWVLGSTSVPFPMLDRTLVLDTFTLGGVLFTMTAVAVTGGGGSPFFLLSLTPSMLAALLGGLRPGLSAAVLSTALLIATALARQDPLGSALALAALYPLLSITVAQIRRILVDLEERVQTAEAERDSTDHRLEQLENANSLLADLAEITGGQDLNPITIGRAGLETLARRYPGAAAVALLNGETGPILLARHGSPVSGGFENVIPLTTGDREVGAVRLTTDSKLAPDELAALRESLRPLALAFANAILLQDIARNAVREERTRLARELHDEIGPSLASLGLALDVALINAVDQREVAEHLEELRDRVGGLVEEVRSTVSDLRTPSSASVRSFLTEISGDIPDSITFQVDVDERRPVRPSLVEPVHRIIGEGVRNAVRHSGSPTISVLGWVDFDRGRLVVKDEGKGFDTLDLPSGHYGVVGMTERAEQAGLRLRITSSMSGTRLDLEWGEP